MITTLKIEKIIESDSIIIPQLKDFIGRTFDIIFIEKVNSINKIKFLSNFFDGIGKIEIDADELATLRQTSLL